MRQNALRACAAVAIMALFGATARAAASDADEPSARLIAAERAPTLHRYRGRLDVRELGLFVAATGGELRIDATRSPGADGWRAAQVDGDTGATLRELPDGLVQGGLGLERFLRVILRDADGERAGGAKLRFCPNLERERLDDSGPATPRYPDQCLRGFPFLRGAVFGIDAGWASRVGPGRIKAPPPGRYTATIRITAAYRQLLGISRADGELELPVRIRRIRGGRGHEKIAATSRADRGGPAASPEPLGAPATADPDPDPATMPDLAALPLWKVRVERRGRRELLSFRASPWNAGPAPLVVEGYRRPGEDRMDAYQYFVDPTDGEVAGRAPAGAMEFHRGRAHNHWHFEQLVRYSLLDPRGGRLVRSRKRSFCIAPTDPVDLTLDGASWRPWDRTGSSCGALGSIWIREALPVGWADTYDQSVSGQAFNITKVPNGRYLLRMSVNPGRELHETRSDNNIADRVIRLRGKRGSREVTVRPWNGIER